MKISRRVFLATGTAMAAVGAGQLGKVRRSVAQGPTILVQKPKDVLNLYSARHYDTDQRLYESFTEKTGIKVNLVEAKADALLERIKSEGANSPADVFITVDAGRLWRATQDDIFLPINSATLTAAVPANLRDSEGRWYGLSKRARVIMYNKDKVNPSELSTYEELTAQEWKGRIAVRSSSNIYNQSLVGSLIAAHGDQKTEEWVRGFVANFARPPEGNDRAQIRAAAAGLSDLAIANTYYLPRFAKSNDPAEQEVFKKVGVFFPNQRDRGTHINISGGGIVKSAPNPEGALKFLEHLVSPEVQEIFAKGNSEYPVVEGVSLDPIVESFGKFKEDQLSASIFGAKNAEALKVMDRGGWK